MVVWNNAKFRKSTILSDSYRFHVFTIMIRAFEANVTPHATSRSYNVKINDYEIVLIV